MIRTIMAQVINGQLKEEQIFPKLQEITENKVFISMISLWLKKGTRPGSTP